MPGSRLIGEVADPVPPARSQACSWYHIWQMMKTTVYLRDEDVAALRRMAARTGRSQAELIRDAVADATARAGAGRRVLHSAGVGRSGLEPVRDVRAALAETGFGERKLERPGEAEREQ